eukprot:1175686-Prorocentrum_minimum.AAC.2
MAENWWDAVENEEAEEEHKQSKRTEVPRGSRCVLSTRGVWSRVYRARTVRGESAHAMLRVAFCHKEPCQTIWCAKAIRLLDTISKQILPQYGCLRLLSRR